MTKRLLSATLAMVCAMGAYAANVGDYIYSNTNRYKVTGTVAVTNGNFSNGVTGWTADDGKGVDETVWAATTVDGKTAVQSQQQTSEAGQGLSNKWELSTGTYVYSYWAKAESNLVTATTVGNNCALFYAITDDATQERVVSEPVSIGTTWTHVVDTIVVTTEKEYLCMTLTGMPTGTAFTDFEIYKADEVYDIRVVERLIAYAEKLVAEPDLSNGADDFMGIIGVMKEAILDPSQNEDAAAMEGLIEQFNVEFDNFMNANGGNTKGTTGDWTQIATTGFKGLTAYGAWKFDGGRWGFSANDASSGRPENDGYVATAGIQKGWEQNWDAYIQTTDLQKGVKYFFSIEAQAVVASSTNISDNPPYGADHNTPLLGEENFKLYVGDTYLDLTGDTLSGYYWKRYYLIAEIPEDAENVKAGVHFYMPSTIGGRFSLRNPEFRLIGKTETQINYEAALASAYLQQTEVLKRLNSYAGDVADYKWAKDSLDRAIDLAQAVYNASLATVAADGTCALPVTTESIDILKALSNDLLENGVRRLNRAKDYVIAQNAIFSTLLTAIKNAKDVLADDIYQEGNKAGLQAAIDAAQASHDQIYASTSDATREADEAALQTAIDELNAAVQTFIESAHLTPVVDIDFSNGFTAVDGEEDTYVVNGAAGTMAFEAGAVNTDNTAAVVKYMLGYNNDPELNEVLRVGNTVATVALPEISNDEALRVSFDIWFGKLTKRYLYVELRNASGVRVAGFGFSSYEGIAEYNDFNNAENTGMDIVGYTTGVGSSTAANGAICVDNNRSSFELIVDYKSNAIQGIVSNPQKGKCLGEALPMPEVSDGDNKVTQFIIRTNYDNNDRRCWFDNLKAYKYASSGSLLDGIETISAEKSATDAIYTLSGVKLNKATKPGLYIINGKKVVIK